MIVSERFKELKHKTEESQHAEESIAKMFVYFLHVGWYASLN